MKYKVNDLEERELDAVVAYLEGILQGMPNESKARIWVATEITYSDGYSVAIPENWRPSGRWAQGGPIIERERIGLDGHPDSDPAKPWKAWLGSVYAYGPTSLVAAMRAYCLSGFGEEVQIP